MPPRPAPRDLRASDADRERVVDVLNAALADGRLSDEEHSGRLHAALTARTLGGLAGLTLDLVPPEEQPIQVDGVRMITGAFSKASRYGRWVVPEEFTVNAMAGEVTLDFREAILTERHTVLHANAVAGTIKLLIPDGVVVTVGGTMLLGRQKGATQAPALGGYASPGGYGSPGAAPRRGSAPLPPDAPLIEVRCFALLGEVIVKPPPKPRRWLPGTRRRAVGG
jgi:hypothetical protein